MFAEQTAHQYQPQLGKEQEGYGLMWSEEHKMKEENLTVPVPDTTVKHFPENWSARSLPGCASGLFLKIGGSIFSGVVKMRFCQFVDSLGEVRKDGQHRTCHFLPIPFYSW